MRDMYTRCPRCGMEFEVIHVYDSRGESWAATDAVVRKYDPRCNRVDVKCPECGAIFLADGRNTWWR